jgi:hypothetical protein
MAKVWRKRITNLIVTADGAVTELVFESSELLAGKKWIEAELKRSPELLTMSSITDAGHELSERSKTARDCAKPLSWRYCTNLLRDFDIWPKKPRNSPKQRSK